MEVARQGRPGPCPRPPSGRAGSLGGAGTGSKGRQLCQGHGKRDEGVEVWDWPGGFSAGACWELPGAWSPGHSGQWPEGPGQAGLSYMGWVSIQPLPGPALLPLVSGERARERWQNGQPLTCPSLGTLVLTPGFTARAWCSLASAPHSGATPGVGSCWEVTSPPQPRAGCPRPPRWQGPACQTHTECAHQKPSPPDTPSRGPAGSGEGVRTTWQCPQWVGSVRAIL